MSMATIVQVDFPHNGPFKDEMVRAFADLAKSINGEKGFLWKIWTENEQTKEAGGIYLFASDETAKAYVDKHTARLQQLGIHTIHAKTFHINEALTTLNHGPVHD